MNICAFIDGQNLHQGLHRPVDYQKFRIYLKEKYKVTKAYYFLGFREKENALYEKLQEAGFILVFNLKGEYLKSQKKGNVDTNIVFHVMKKLYAGELIGALLISGDGDYKMMVDYLEEEGKLRNLCKIPKRKNLGHCMFGPKHSDQSLRQRFLEETRSYRFSCEVENTIDFNTFREFFRVSLIKVLSPNLRFASSLYRNAKNLDPKYFDFLDKVDIQKKIGYTKKPLR